MKRLMILVLMASAAFSGVAWATGLEGDKEAQAAREAARKGFAMSFWDMRNELDPVAVQRTQNLEAITAPPAGQFERLEAIRAMLDAVALYSSDGGTIVLDETAPGLGSVPVSITPQAVRLVKK